MISFMVLTAALAADPPSNLPNDPQSIRMRIDHNMRAAEEQLRRQNIATDAKRLQEEVLRDIDRLLALLKEQPEQQTNQPNQSHSEQASNPPQDSSKRKPDKPDPSNGADPTGGSGQRDQSPKGNDAPRPGGGSAGRQPQANEQPSGGRNSRGEARRERRARAGRSNNAMAKGQDAQPTPGDQQRNGPTGARPGESQGKAGTNPDNATGTTMPPNQTNGAPARMADMNRAVWGHLPPTLRQEVDHYYRDRFMPRYQEMLQQYYSQLAESKRTDQERK